ncbi:MAG: hypothetical protein LLG00_15130 [Planctomycetaceae bacterium]|nr:hypothetical protein [Planctomycetaceae bacterium]
MAKSDTVSGSDARKSSSKKTPRQGIELTPTARLDPPHELAAALDPPDEASLPWLEQPDVAFHPSRPGELPTDIPDEPATEQVRLEAAQLAKYLRAQQRELDNRQAALNSQIARFESDARASRLWLDEQQAELAASTEAIAAQQRQSASQSAAIETARQNIALQQQELADQNVALSQQQQKVLQQQSRLAEQEREMRQRLNRLAVAESALQRREEELSARLAVAEQAASMTQRSAAEDARAQEELERRRQAVERRAEHVEQCRAALEPLRAELGRMHRETLEIRLATEELWAQLSGAAPPATLVRSLGQIRTRLARQYAQENADLAQQRQQLETIRSQLLAQHQKLAERKRQFDRWAAECQHDTQEQASRLIAREQKLRQEEGRLREQFHHWRMQRMAAGRQSPRQKWQNPNAA